ncbi:MAG: hypothetical protein IJW45_03310 [Oscillospiraceae bacterium]|nr:hypothetical protein [Oscillospiraceae bacterium]
MERLIDFLDRLESGNIYYRLNKIRDSILVEIAVPGQRWEVEFMRDGEVLVERFVSTGDLGGEEELAVLFREF